MKRPASSETTGRAVRLHRAKNHSNRPSQFFLTVVIFHGAPEPQVNLGTFTLLSNARETPALQRHNNTAESHEFRRLLAHRRICDPHVKVGLVAGDGGALIWPQLIGYVRAKQYLLTGDMIDAKAAQQIGLITAAVPEADLDKTVDEWVARLSRNSPLAVRWTKATINTGLKQLAGTILDTGAAYEGMSFRSDDLGESLAAIRDRRKPEFKGR